MLHNQIIGEKSLNEKIKNNSPFYYMRCTPFTAHGEYNYYGDLTETFFYKNLFSEDGKYEEYLLKIKNRLNYNPPKSIIIIGNQGCGKTTLVNRLKHDIPSHQFDIIDFDRNTSNPKLIEYIELMSKYLIKLFNDDLKNGNYINNILYSNYFINEELFLEKINANDNIEQFFKKFKKTYIDKNFTNFSPSSFIKIINKLYFNQILSIIVLWYVSKFKYQNKIEKIIFCFDNLDVLVNKQIIDGFFKDYFWFCRNVDDILQHMKNSYVNKTKINYSECFTFIFSTRSTTWSKIKDTYIHQANIIRLSTLKINVSDAFDKQKIFDKRYKYIIDNKQDFPNFDTKIESVRKLLRDFEDHHNIYELFNDDYRQCSITFEELLDNNPNLINEYLHLVNDKNLKIKNGAKGIIYKALFDKFRDEELFEKIGVLNIRNNAPLVSNARLILSYLDSFTYYENIDAVGCVSFYDLARDLDGIVNKNEINKSLINMFKLGIDSSWNELIGFDEIYSDKLSNCYELKIFITKAGHEYLDLISTHFEFFNSRSNKKSGITNIPLFSPKSLDKLETNPAKYNFEFIIERVIKIVNKCCDNMVIFYENYMKEKYKDKNGYLNSPFVFTPGKDKVFHGERILHTHIRYLDQFRLYAIRSIKNEKEAIKVNKILLLKIKEYLDIGYNHPDILSEISTSNLFPRFKENLEYLMNHLNDFSTEII